MKTITTFLVIIIFCCAQACSTPFPIPFLGTTGPSPSSSPTTHIYSAGEVITQVSQINSFGLWVSAQISAAATATAYLAPWQSTTSTAGTPLASASITLPSTAGTYTLVSATLNYGGLNPNSSYVVYFSFPAATSQAYTVYSVPATSGFGGLVTAVDGTWASGTNADASLVLSSTNTLNLVALNYAQGHGNNPNGWNCIYQNDYSAIQVNWQTLNVNTAYSGSQTSSLIVNNGGCEATATIPYGTAAGCGWRQSFALINLTGTNYAVADSFVSDGYEQEGSVSASSNNQVYQLMGTGNCGYTVTTEGNAAGEAASTINGGFYLQLTYF